MNVWLENIWINGKTEEVSLNAVDAVTCVNSHYSYFGVITCKTTADLAYDKAYDKPLL